MDNEIRTFLVRNRDSLFDRTTRLIHIQEAAVQFCTEKGIKVTDDIVREVGLESHFVRAVGLV